VLFVMDPIDKLNLFYVWNNDMTGVVEAGGYFIYYDQNKGMQEYMNNNRINRAKHRDFIKQDEEAPTTKMRLFKESNKEEVPAGTPERGRRAISSIKTTPAKEKGATRGVEDVRKMSNLLIGLCAVLFITTFIMGAGLLQSDARIGALESAIITMDNNHVIIADQIRQLASLPVFAEQNGRAADAGHITAPVVTPPPTLTPPPVPTPEPETTPTPPPESTPEPEPEPEPTPTPTVPVFANIPETYTIQPGDSLFAISNMFFGDASMVERIMEVNDIEDPNHILVGQVLILPTY